MAPQTETPPSSDDASSSAPRYRWLADVIRDTIDRGHLEDNTAIPSERELAERYAVSRDTVRKAVQYLEGLGVLNSDHGRGTFVSPALVRKMSRFLDSFSQDTAARGAVAGQNILSIETVPASMALAGLLGVEPGHVLTRICRVRLINGKPIGIHDAYLPLDVSEGRIDRALLEKVGSLYQVLREDFGVIPAEAIENLWSGSADRDDAELLGIERGAPLLICERVTLSDRRRAIEYCLMKYVQSYRYSNRITKHSGAD